MWIVVLITGRMREQLANGDVVGARQARQVFAHAVVERQLAVLGRQQDGAGHELLAH